MTKRPLIRVALGLLVLVVISIGATACGGGGSSGGDLTGKIWSATTVSGKPLVDGTSITMVFSDKQMSGSAGCNNYSTAYNTGKDSITLGQAISTQKACEPDISSQESTFLGLFPSIQRYKVDGDSLTLSGSSDEELVVAQAVSQDLAGTSWNVVAYNNGKDAVVGVLTSAAMTADFSDSGGLSGSSGCNTYNTTYDATPPEITIDKKIATTMKACADDVMAQETAYLAALGSAATYEVDGPTAQLKDASGATVVQLAHK